MNNIFQEKRSTFLLLVGLLFVLLIVLYFAFISPLLSDLKGKETTQTDLQNEIAILESQLEQLDNAQEDFEQDLLELQKKIPPTRELEEIVLILRDIERHSSSLIKSIDFHYGSSLPSANFWQELDSDEVLEGEVDADEEAEETPAIDFSQKPESLQIITIKMDISSPNYEEFLSFITEIEQQERIMGVSELKFDKPGEEVTHNVELFTFYYKK